MCPHTAIYVLSGGRAEGPTSIETSPVSSYFYVSSYYIYITCVLRWKTWKSKRPEKHGGIGLYFHLSASGGSDRVTLWGWLGLASSSGHPCGHQLRAAESDFQQRSPEMHCYASAELSRLHARVQAAFCRLRYAAIPETFYVRMIHIYVLQRCLQAISAYIS